MGIIAYYPLSTNLKSIVGDYPDLSPTSTSYNFSSIGKTRYTSAYQASCGFKVANPFVGLNEWSLALWFKENGTDDWSDIITFSSDDKQRLEYWSSGKNLTWYSSGTSYGKFLPSGTTVISGITAKTWHHLILTFKNGNSRVYIDGELKVKDTTGMSTFTTGASDIYIGCRISAQFAKQYVNDLIFFDNALTKKNAKKLSQGCFFHFNFSNLLPASESTTNSNNNLKYSNNAMFYPEFAGTGVNETIVKNASLYGTDVLSCTGTAGKDYIKFTSPWPSGSTVTDTSVAIWFKNSNTEYGYYPLFYPGDGSSTWSGTSGIWISYNCETTALWEYDQKTGNYVKYGTSLPAGWHYIVFTMSGGSTQKFYLDGTEVHSVDISGSVTNGQSIYCVGNTPNGWSGVMSGTYVADVAVYARALSAAEVESNYHTMAEIHKDNSVTAVTITESEDNPLLGDGSTSTYKYPFFSKNGNLTARALSEELELEDGSVWVPVMHHNNSGGTNLFTYGDNFSKFVYHNSECWAKFNIITNFGYKEGSTTWYEFLLFEQKDENSVSVRRRWKQKVNPLTTASYDVAKRSAGNITPIENVNSAYGCLYKLNSSSTSYLIQANATSGNWFGACGSYKTHGVGIPDANGSSLAGIKDLYIRKVDKTNTVKIYDNGCINSKSFSENLVDNYSVISGKKISILSGEKEEDIIASYTPTISVTNNQISLSGFSGIVDRLVAATGESESEILSRCHYFYIEKKPTYGSISGPPDRDQKANGQGNLYVYRIYKHNTGKEYQPLYTSLFDSSTILSYSGQINMATHATLIKCFKDSKQYHRSNKSGNWAYYADIVHKKLVLGVGILYRKIIDGEQYKFISNKSSNALLYNFSDLNTLIEVSDYKQEMEI